MSSDQPNQEEQDERCFDRKFFISLIVGISLTIAVLYYFYQYPAFAQEIATESIPNIEVPIIEKYLPYGYDEKEIIEKRTKSSQTFRNDDGSETLRLYASPLFKIHVDDGSWLRKAIISDVSAQTATVSSAKDTEIVVNSSTNL